MLSKRLKVALKEIINPDLIGYMEGRFCGENRRLISDIIEYCEYHKIPSVIHLEYFEKAFDTVKWKFLKSVLKGNGFSPSFIDWVTILYKNAESCVTNKDIL